MQVFGHNQHMEEVLWHAGIFRFPFWRYNRVREAMFLGHIDKTSSSHKNLKSPNSNNPLTDGLDLIIYHSINLNI